MSRDDVASHRTLMMAAFKRHFVPALGERGFVGSFPHLRRPSAERVDYLNVQFYSAGGSFTLNLGRTGPNGFVAGPWKDLPVDQIEVGHIWKDRRRLAPRDLPGRRRGGDWWEFGPRSYDDPRPPEPRHYYDRIADEVLEAIVTVGEPWFARPDPPEDGTELPSRGGRDPTLVEGPLAGLTRFLPWNRSLRVGCIVGPLDPPLHRWETWATIMPAIGVLLEHLPRAAAIRSFQSRPGESKWLPFGKLPWSEASNRKWATRYLEADEPVDFQSTEIWSPSCGTWAKEGKDPELYASVDWSPVLESQGFILALRRDQLRTPGLAEAADRVMDAVAAALPGARRIVCDRGWSERRILFAIRENSLDYTASHRVMEWAEAHPSRQVASFST